VSFFCDANGMPSPALLVAGRIVSARNLGLLLLESSETLLTGCGRRGTQFSEARAGEIEARSKVGDGMLSSIDGESVGGLVEPGSMGEKSGKSCERPCLFCSVGEDGDAGVDLRRPARLWRPGSLSDMFIASES